MIVALQTASKLDFRGWMLGIFGALISGGAGAVGGGFGTVIIDPEHFNVRNGGFTHLMEVMACAFAFSGVISLMKFLQLNPVPQPMTINTPGPVNVTQTSVGTTVETVGKP